jgi:hypothetical protein
MRFTRAIPVALAVTAAFVAVPVMARAPSGAATRVAEDTCVALQAETDADESRFACAKDGDDVWAAWIAPPATGAHDLVLTTVHVGPRGTRTARSDLLPGAASWFPTIAPITIATSEGGATVDVVRVGFRAYPLARRVLPR